MPLAETSPVRQLRLHHGLTQKQCAEGCGLSVSTWGAIERLRNPAWVEILSLQVIDPTLTTFEVVARVCAFFGVINYFENYTQDQVVKRLAREAKRLGTLPLFTKSGISTRTRPCKLPYPDTSTLRPPRQRDMAVA